MATNSEPDVAPHERLRVWHHTVALINAIYRETTWWPRDERFGIVSQIRRASVSIATNLAEGKARTGVRQYRAFVQIAYGSAREVEALLAVATGLKFARPENAVLLRGQLKTVTVHLYRLLMALQDERPFNAHTPHTPHTPPTPHTPHTPPTPSFNS